MNRLISVISAGCAIALSGCGTMTDVMCGPVPLRYYGGVQNDAAVVELGGRKLLSVQPIEHSDEPRSIGQAMLCVGFGLVDI
ncbi:MAG TPA: hypothetical protein VKE94_22380, partial [Gemmataceae bacterium]|nr:hypothetical protein [Gemmataceae bacterium]